MTRDDVEWILALWFGDCVNFHLAFLTLKVTQFIQPTNVCITTISHVWKVSCSMDDFWMDKLRMDKDRFSVFNSVVDSCQFCHTCHCLRKLIAYVQLKKEMVWNIGSVLRGYLFHIFMIVARSCHLPLSQIAVGCHSSFARWHWLFWNRRSCEKLSSFLKQH